jgi:hypothetical protein
MTLNWPLSRSGAPALTLSRQFTKPTKNPPKLCKKKMPNDLTK